MSPEDVIRAVFEELERYRGVVPDFDAFLEVSGERLPTTARCNTLRAESGEVRERLDAETEDLEWLDEGFRVDTDSPGNALEYLLGLFHVQEEVSMIPPKALDPGPGERVLDLCAAPGSKATQLAALMENRGTLVANDRSAGRISALKNNLDRLGVLNCAVTRLDGARFPGREGFDGVLLDPPCSGEGTTRKDPEVLRYAERRRRSLPGVQRALMRRAAGLLRSGGSLIYSTCTYAPEENEAIVAEGLERGLELAELDGVPEGEPGLGSWRGDDFPGEMELCRRYYPHRLDSGGFFVARLVKP